MNLETLDMARLAHDVKRHLYVFILKEHLPKYLEGKLDEALTKKITQAQFLRINIKHIKRYQIQLEKRFAQMRREVLGNIKKTPKSFIVAKFDVDQWLFSRQKWRGIFTEDNKLYTAVPLEDGGKLIMDDLNVGIAFDQNAPRAIKWIAENAKNAGWSITQTQYDRLKVVLMDALADGLSIPKIRDRIEAAMEVTKASAERIARTEVLKASNRGVWLGMQQSGVVEGKRWLATADRRVCPRCAEMEGATMRDKPLDEPFFKKGDSFTFHGTDETPAPTDAGLTDVFDYEEIQHPPLHTSCRCVLLAILKEV